MRGIGSEIAELLGVGGVIVEFRAFAAFVPFGETPAFGADSAAHHGLRKTGVGRAQNLGDGAAVPLGRWMGEQRLQAAAGQIGGERKSAAFGERGKNIHEFDDAGAGRAVAPGRRITNDQRSTGGFLEESSFLPDAEMLAEMIADTRSSNRRRAGPLLRCCRATVRVCGAGARVFRRRS